MTMAKDAKLPSKGPIIYQTSIRQVCKDLIDHNIQVHATVAASI
jgi:hypothetical protein